MVSVANMCIWHAGMMRLQSILACQLGKARKEKARTKEGWPLLCRLLYLRPVQGLKFPMCRPSKGKGSRTKPIPEEVNRKLGEATLHYASGR